MLTKTTRRGFIQSLTAGSILFPGVLAELLAQENPGNAPRAPADPLEARPPHFTPKARRVILLFSTGGVSHMDTFDHKPRLIAADERTLVPGGGLSLERRPLVRPRWTFRRGGRSGAMVSDLFPHVRDQMDDICLINSM